MSAPEDDDRAEADLSLPDLDCYRQTFRGEHDGLRLSTISFEDCAFIGCSLVGAQLARCSFLDCTFTSCNLAAASLRASRFVNTTFEDCKLTGIDWTITDWPRVALGRPRFLGCNLSYATFAGLPMDNIVIERCDCEDVDLIDAVLTGASLVGSSFVGASFTGTDLTNAHLEGASSYRIDPALTRIRGASFSLPDVLNLLEVLGIDVVDAPGSSDPS